MERFINDDVELRNGGRKGVKMSIDELRSKLWKYIQALDDADDFFDLSNMSDDEELANLVAVRDERLQKDIKFANYCENIIFNLSDLSIGYEGRSLLGFHTLDNGFTFYGAMGGSDWSYPMFSIFYHDGNRVRAYTPVRGNTVNVDFKSALGLEGEYYKSDENKIMILYLKKYGISEVLLNFDAMKEEIEARIVLA